MNFWISVIRSYFKNLQDLKASRCVVFLSSFLVIFITFLLSLLVSCTLSFQNIDTHGTATDLVDEEQKSSSDFSPTVQLPIKPL